MAVRPKRSNCLVNVTIIRYSELAFRRKSKMFSLHVIRSDTLASAQILQTAQTPSPSVVAASRDIMAC